MARSGWRGLKRFAPVPGTPLRMMLASRVQDLHEVPPHMHSEMFVEYKHDGERVQIHSDWRCAGLFAQAGADHATSIPRSSRHSIGPASPTTPFSKARSSLSILRQTICCRFKRSCSVGENTRLKRLSRKFRLRFSYSTCCSSRTGISSVSRSRSGASRSRTASSHHASFVCQTTP